MTTSNKNLCDMFKTPLCINDIVAFPSAYGHSIVIGRIVEVTGTGNIKISYKNFKNSKRITHPSTVIKLDVTNHYLLQYLLLEDKAI